MSITDTYRTYEKYIVFAIRVAIGIMFIYSGFTKFEQPFYFENVVAEYGILPPFLVHPFSILLPWAEVVVGASLLLGILKRYTSYIVLLMLFMFIVAVSIQIVKGSTGDCGCGLPGENFSEVLIRDFVMFAATVLVARSDTEFLETYNR